MFDFTCHICASEREREVCARARAEECVEREKGGREGIEKEPKEKEEIEVEGSLFPPSRDFERERREKADKRAFIG